MSAILLYGALGGVVRGFVGYTKYQFSYKNVPFNLLYFFLIVVLSAVVGSAITWAIDNSGVVLYGIADLNPALAFIVGYAGGDFLENVYKILAQKPFLGPLSKILSVK